MSDPDANRIMSENCEGVINVSKKTNIGNINKNSNKSFEAYTINGRFVGASNSMKTLYHKLDKGLYIIGGKKYIIGVR